MIAGGRRDLWFGNCDNCRHIWSEMLYVTVVVADTTVRIIPPSSSNVYPRYLGVNNSTDKNDTLNLQIQTQFNGSPAKYVWVKIDTTVLADSGGHSHGGTRPLGTFLISRTTPPGYDSVRTFPRQTDSTGMLSFKYIASQFGGIEKIRVTRLSDTTSFDTLRITTRVPGLQAISTTHANLITSTSTEAYHRLANSDYGLSTTINSIYSALDGYANVRGMPSNIYLAAVDMSLPNGGGFDIAGGWNADIQKGAAGHILHREGKSVDFSKYYRDANGNIILVNIYRDGVLVKTTNRIDQDLLDRLFDQLGFDRKEIKIDKIHYESNQ